MDVLARNKKILYDIVMKNDVKKLEQLLKDRDSTMSVNQTIQGESTTALHLAVSNDHPDMVKLLLESGANKYYRSGSGNTCLHLATRTGNVDLVLLFLQYIDVNDWNASQQTPLHVAVAQNHAELVDIFLQNRADVDIQDADGNTPLHLAVRSQSIPLVRLLLKHGANPNLKNVDGSSAFHKVLQLRDLDDELLDAFLGNDANVHLRDDSGRNALHLAVACAGCNVVYRLLKIGKNVNEPTRLYRMTPLHLVLLYNARSEEVVSNIACFLVIRGANVNAIDENDRTPLFNAVSSRHAKVARYLLSVGADVNGFGKRIPVIEAVRKCDIDMVECLIDHGAKLDARNEHGESTLLYALGCLKDEKLRYDVVKLLLDRGASAKDCDAKGSTALHRAIDEHDLKLFNLLIERGASIHAVNRNRESPLYAAVASNFYDAAKSLIAMGCKVNDCSQNLLLLAVSRGNKKMMSLLLNNGASTGDGRALMLAAADESVVKMKLLVANGAVVEANSLPGHLIFVKAIRARRAAMVEYFLENGASVNFEHENRVALSHAFEVFSREHRNSEKSVDSLVKYIALESELNPRRVHETNVVLIKSKQWTLERYKVYQQELASMKQARVCPEFATTYFDILVKRQNALVQCLRRRRIKTTLLKGHYEQLFKNYSYELKVNYLRGLGRLQMIDELHKILNGIFQSVLPYDVVGKISEYYNDEDFVACLKK